MAMSDYEHEMLQEMKRMSCCFERILHQMELMQGTMEKVFKHNMDCMIEVNEK